MKDYPVRTKCIALFQKIHGADTLLFAMYVYEYGHECPAPNRRRVYVSYLDSVQYFEPKCYRTLVYHTVLVEYLRYVKTRGFYTAHFWSCPPTPGDDYIFHVHPSHQLVPREDMLRAWYHDMLDRAKAEGIVIRTTTLYDEYFVKSGLDSVPQATGRPTCLPYFEGDYIPGEIETIIKLEQEEKSTVSLGTRDEDTVMARLGLNLRKMKDNFIVVHLRSRRFAAAVESGDDVSAFKDDSDEELVRSKRAKISGKDTASLCMQTDHLDQAGSALGNESTAQAIPKDHIVAASSENDHPPRSSGLQLVDEVKNSEQDSDPDAALVATETSHSRTSTQDEIANNVTHARDRELLIFGDCDVPTKDIESNNACPSQRDKTNESLEPIELPVTAELLTAIPSHDDEDAQEGKNPEDTGVEGEPMEIADGADGAESRSTTSASVKKDEETEEHVNRTNFEAENHFEQEDPSHVINTDPELPHDTKVVSENFSPEIVKEDCLGPQTNQEQVSDSASIDNVRVDDKRPEDNEKEALDVEQRFTEGTVESKQVTEDDDKQAVMKVSLGSKIIECDRSPEIVEEKGVLDETSRNDEEMILPHPVDTNQVTFNDEMGAPDKESVNDDARTADPEGKSGDEAEALDNEYVGAGVVVTKELEEDKTEAIKGDSVTVNTVKDINDNSLISHGEDVKDDVEIVMANPAGEKDESQVPGLEANKCVAANPPGENKVYLQASDDETLEATKLQAITVGENKGEAFANDTVKSDIVTAVSAGETLSTIDQVSDVVNEKHISTSEAAVANFVPGQEVLMAESVATTSSDRERVASNSGIPDKVSHEGKDQIPDVEAIMADQQPLKPTKETLEPATMVNDVSEVEGINLISQAETAIEHSFSSNQELSTLPRDNTIFENVQNPDATSSEVQPTVTCSDVVDQVTHDPSSSVDTSGQQLLKRGIEEVKPLLSRHFDEMNRSPKHVLDTADPDEPIEVELFESRQRFLNYCQTSHCQFDELRRAKHSTMMVLFQLHNPAAPLFLQQCGACYRDITHGVRYSCNNCSKFDLCEDCYKPVTSGLWAKRDSRFEHDPSHTFTPIDMEVSIDSAMSQEDRQKALKAHCALLEHAGDCPGAPACSLQNCQKMKKLFNHVRSCEIKPKSDCRICTRLISLCAIHARTCKIADSCPVPFCDRIRDRNERLQRQQQLMDDRRRQAQNDLYHTS